MRPFFARGCLFWGLPQPPSPRARLVRHSPQGDDGCDRFLFVGVCFGGFRSPQAPAPGATGSGIFTAVCVWRWRRCVKVFLQISPLFCGKICKKLRRGLPHPGATIASCLRNVLPRTPSLLPVARDGGVRYCTLRLFYSSRDCRRGNTVTPSPLQPRQTQAAIQ